MIGLILATMWEAEPFVRELDFRECDHRPFPVYATEDMRLIVSGIGKTNAAMACVHLINQHHPACICNLGAAGATSNAFGLGECYHVARVIEPDRPDLKTGRAHAHALETLEGFPLVGLITQDRPVVAPAERAGMASSAGIMDMEGAAVAHVCRRFQVPCYIFKFISDTPDHTQAGDILEHIFQFRGDFCRFFCTEVLPVMRVRVLKT